MFALATTLNATLSWITKGILISCEDGWLPKSLGKVNKKFGTPHWLLTVFYVVGLIPILTGLSLETISALGTGVLLVANVIPIIASSQLPKKYPELYMKAPFKLSKTALNIVVVLAVILLAVQGYLLLSSLSYKFMIGAGIYMVAAALYVIIFGNRLNIKKNLSFAEDPDSPQHPTNIGA